MYITSLLDQEPVDAEFVRSIPHLPDSFLPNCIDGKSRHYHGNSFFQGPYDLSVESDSSLCVLLIEKLFKTRIGIPSTHVDANSRLKVWVSFRCLKVTIDVELSKVFMWTPYIESEFMLDMDKNRISWSGLLFCGDGTTWKGPFDTKSEKDRVSLVLDCESILGRKKPLVLARQMSNTSILWIQHSDEDKTEQVAKKEDPLVRIHSQIDMYSKTSIRKTRIKVIAYRILKKERILEYGAAIYKQNTDAHSVKGDPVDLGELEGFARDRLHRAPVRVLLPNFMMHPQFDLSRLPPFIYQLMIQIGCSSESSVHKKRVPEDHLATVQVKSCSQNKQISVVSVSSSPIDTQSRTKKWVLEFQQIRDKITQSENELENLSLTVKGYFPGMSRYQNLR